MLKMIFQYLRFLSRKLLNFQWFSFMTSPRFTINFPFHSLLSQFQQSIFKSFLLLSSHKICKFRFLFFLFLLTVDIVIGVCYFRWFNDTDRMLEMEKKCRSEKNKRHRQRILSSFNWIKRGIEKEKKYGKWIFISVQGRIEFLFQWL